MAYYKRTRVISQDMRTGEFAYLDQLIKDGYNPGLWVLPKNWEPPLRQGPSSLLPIVPIINLSPPNLTDTYPVILQNLVNVDTGAAVLELFSIGACGTVTTWNINQNITGIESIGTAATGMDNVAEAIIGQSSTGSIGNTTDSVSQSFISIAQSIGNTGTYVYSVSVNVTGISSTGSVGTSIDDISQIISTSGFSTGSTGTVLNGSGWGQGGGWGVNGWGSS